MCCRYYLEESPELRPFVEAMNRSPLTERFRQEALVVERGEVYPANVVPVVAVNRKGQRSVFPMRWGFSGKTLLINARTETAAVRPLFRDAWVGHRCIIPASWYYEWEHLVSADGRKKTGKRYILQPRGASLTWLCGLYRMEKDLPCFVILTRPPAEDIRFIHDRMPLMLPERCVDDWIRPGTDPGMLLENAQTDILHEPAV